MTAPRVAVAGVVRRRQGLGEHLARFLVKHGAEMPAFLQGRASSIAEGHETLARYGLVADGFTDLGSLLAKHRIDALVIASPAATHERLLKDALRAGLHVLNEKPFVWDCADPVAATTAIAVRFRARGLILHENVQWPHTLGAFRALHPGWDGGAPKHLEMWLAPSGTGRSMLIDAISHPLSLIQALAEPTGPVSGLCFSTVNPAAGTLECSFRVPFAESGAVVRVRLTSHPTQPRPAGYAIDGLPAERRVRIRDYALSFEHEGRTVPVPDPMERLVADFVTALRSGGSPPRWMTTDAIVWRMQALCDVIAGFRKVTGPGSG